jgi:hypothetical protein
MNNGIACAFSANHLDGISIEMSNKERSIAVEMTKKEAIALVHWLESLSLWDETDGK